MCVPCTFIPITKLFISGQEIVFVLELNEHGDLDITSVDCGFISGSISIQNLSPELSFTGNPEILMHK